MNYSMAVNIFLRQAVRERGIPSRVTRDVPNAEARATTEESERKARDPNARGARCMEASIVAMVEDDV